MYSLLVLFVVVVFVKAQMDPLPWYYHDLNGPEFTNKTVDNNVQVRDYTKQLWASTDIFGTDITEAGSIGFNLLFEYISGANDQSTAIDMTTPVLTKVVPGAGPNCNSTFTVSFFVPYKYQDPNSPPPNPTNKAVYIQSQGPLHVAVSEFDGYQVQAKDLKYIADLEADVQTSKDVNLDPAYGDSWWLAGYDPPFRVTNRHNEVWAGVIDTAQ